MKIYFTFLHLLLSLSINIANLIFLINKAMAKYYPAKIKKTQKRVLSYIDRSFENKRVWTLFLVAL